MKLFYLLSIYMVYSIIVIYRQVRETYRTEKEKIKEGYRPIGDSTYILYFVSLMFKLIVSGIIIGFWGYMVIPVTNYWLFVLYVALIFFALEWSSGLVHALVISIFRAISVRRQKEQLNKKADQLNKELLAKQRSDNK